MLTQAGASPAASAAVISELLALPQLQSMKTRVLELRQIFLVVLHSDPLRNTLSFSLCLFKL